MHRIHDFLSLRGFLLRFIDSKSSLKVCGKVRVPVCMCVRTCVCMHVYVYACMHVCTRVHVCTHVSTFFFWEKSIVFTRYLKCSRSKEDGP